VHASGATAICRRSPREPRGSRTTPTIPIGMIWSATHATMRINRPSTAARRAINSASGFLSASSNNFGHTITREDPAHCARSALSLEVCFWRSWLIFETAAWTRSTASLCCSCLPRRVTEWYGEPTSGSVRPTRCLPHPALGQPARTRCRAAAQDLRVQARLFRTSRDRGSLAAGKTRAAR
jgi:hypothetical protein